MPLLNGYKKEFVLKRIPQTLLGGLKLHLGYRAPFYVYVTQIILFIVPFIVGGILTLITELAGVRFDIICYVYGSLMMIFVLIVQITSLMRTRKGPTVSPDTEIKHNILSDDDEIDFESCFGKETIGFVSPVKPSLVLIPLHALFCGLVSGLGLWFLLPSVLTTLYGSTAVTVIVAIFGWLSLCIGLYSLTVLGPPELSQYRALVTYDVVPGRPVHMVICFLLHVIAVSVADSTGTLTTVNQVTHVIFCILPLLWMSGIMPSTEPLVLWIVEQAHVHVLGGSHMANPIRTLSIATLSALTLLVYLARDSPSTVLITLTGLGYCLSLDVCGLVSSLIQFCLQRCRFTRRPSAAGVCKTVVRMAFYVIMLGLACSTTALTNFYNSSVTTVRQSLAYGIIGSFCFDLVLRNLQKVYWFGLVRNPVFPPDVNKARSFRRRKAFLYVIGLFRRFFLNAVTPLLMLVYTASLFSSEYTSAITYFWHCITVARMLRWIFQSTSTSLLDLSVHVILAAVIPAPTSSTWWHSVGSGSQLFIISITRDRLVELLNKLYTLLVLVIGTATDHKKYNHFKGETFVKCVLPIILVPVYLCCVLVPAALLSAPLLPLFTLPFFWISAPRPRHFWAPQTSLGTRRSEVSDGDAVFYEQAMPAITDMVKTAISCGSLGSHPGAQHLLRYQDRLVWISVLERGYAYTTVQIKGLELQETSCHTVEAARVDEIFENAFERESSCGFNRHLLNTLTPRDSNFIGTYSDARNVLTGIIDSPDNLQRVHQNLSKALTWVILHHLLESRRVALPLSLSKDQKINLDSTPMPKVSGTKLPPLNHAKDGMKSNGVDMKSAAPLPPLASSKTPVVQLQSLKPSTPENVKTSKLKSRQIDDCDLEDLLDDWDSPSPSPVPKERQQTKVSLFTGRAISPTRSEAESVWSNDSGDQVPLKPVKSAPKPNLLPSLSNRMDDFQVEDEDSFSPPNFLSNDVMNRFGVQKAGTNLLSDVKFKPLAAVYEPPARWMNVPLERDVLESVTRSLSLSSWIKLVLDRISLSDDDTSGNVRKLAEDEMFCKLISYLVAMGHWVFYEDMASERAPNLGSSHVYRSYVGQVYNSTAELWLETNPDLKELLVKSYRFSVKLMIDQAVLGPCEDLEEFADSFSDYDQIWYIGQESDPLWGENVSKGTLNLFSIYHSAYNNTYTSRTLSHIKLPVHVGSLNEELVRAQWANLCLELLYMTNDDDERDSIQAEGRILRNMTVQSADPPLGYPLYTSSTISLQSI